VVDTKFVDGGQNCDSFIIFLYYVLCDCAALHPPKKEKIDIWIKCSATRAMAQFVIPNKRKW
jgi:hypothetical protein